jgi:hypothetical protein
MHELQGSARLLTAASAAYTRLMSKGLRVVHIVSVTIDGRTEHWAVAASRTEAREVLKKHLPEGAVMKLENRFLSPQEIEALNLPPRGFERLG